MAMSKNWCWTLNNPIAEEFDSLTSDVYTYSVVGKEVGEEGTPHAQGYTIFKKNQRLSAVKKLLPRAHWEVRKGSHEQASDYCKKDGDFMEDGTPPMSKKRQGECEKERWSEAVKRAKLGEIDDIDPDIQLRFYRTLKDMKRDYMTKPADVDGTCGVWIYGESGSGKSRLARDDYPDAYDKPANKWWDGYQLEENVIIDDLDQNHKVLGHHLKIWADRYSFIAETKGGAVSIRPSSIVVTSQYRIEDIWEDEATREALNRRFKKIHVTQRKKNDN